MLSNETLSRIEKLASDVAVREGCELYDIEFIGSGRGRVLRVYIDKADGVGVEDCSNVSKGLNLLLDVEDPIPGGQYNLEVSSPGLDRVLSKPHHFAKAVGKKVSFKLSKSLSELGFPEAKPANAKNIDATILKFTDGRVHVDFDGQSIEFDIGAVSRAKLVFEIKTGTKK